MALSINTNIASLNAQRNLGKTQGTLTKSLERLSSGLRINSAKDDSAGLAIANRMNSQIRGLNQAVRNANDGISLSQTAEGALQESTNILQRMRELAVQSANDTNSASDRASLQAEVNQLQAELTRIAETTTFNGKALLKGTLTNAQFQVGANANETISLNIASAKAVDLGNNALTTSNDNGLEAAIFQSFVSTGGGENGNSGALQVNEAVVAGTNGLTGEILTITNAADGSTQEVTIAAAEDLGAANKAIANLEALTGVKATGFNKVILSAGADSSVLTINGDAVSAGALALDDASAIATAINADTDQQALGNFAKVVGSNVEVYNQTGKDITVSIAGTAANALTVTGIDGTDRALNTDGAADGDDAAAFAGSMNIVLEQGYSLASSGNNLLFAGAANATEAVNEIAGYTDGSAGTAVAAQILSIVGPEGSSTASIAINSSAAGIATAVNDVAATTGVTAKAKTEATLSNLSNDGTVTFALSGTNTASAVTISATVTTGDLSALATVINDATGQTGITAELSGSNNEIVLKHSSGENIKIENFTHSAAVDAATTATGVGVDVDYDGTKQSIDITGNEGVAVSLFDGGFEGDLDSAVIGGEVTFSASASFNITSDIAANDAGGSIFSGVASSSNTSTLSDISTVNISTVAGAAGAIESIDGALSQIDTMRGDLGAIQNRFETTISNLQNVSENISAARSRIMDADFAVETAALTKSQILQQAGVAMLAQANQLPQTVLSLLQ
jgi:flagellin